MGGLKLHRAHVVFDASARKMKFVIDTDAKVSLTNTGIYIYKSENHP